MADKYFKITNSRFAKQYIANQNYRLEMSKIIEDYLKELGVKFLDVAWDGSGFYIELPDYGREKQEALEGQCLEGNLVQWDNVYARLKKNSKINKEIINRTKHLEAVNSPRIFMYIDAYGKMSTQMLRIKDEFYLKIETENELKSWADDWEEIDKIDWLELEIECEKLKEDK